MQTLCLVFDIDDTLYLERDYVLSGFHAVGRWAQDRAGISGFADVAASLFNHGRRGSIFDEALSRMGLKPADGMVQEMVNVYRNHVPEICLLPDAAESLRSFENDATMAVITDGPLASQRNKYDRLGLDRFCNRAIFTGEWGTEFSKPHLRSFQTIEQQVGKKYHRFVYVADNPDKDFIAPNSLGWDTIRVRRPGGLHFEKDATPATAARFELNDLSRLSEALECSVSQ